MLRRTARCDAAGPQFAAIRFASIRNIDFDLLIRHLAEMD